MQTGSWTYTNIESDVPKMQVYVRQKKERFQISRIF
jgi:hypothetical protein